MIYAMYPHFVNECVRQPFTWANPVTGLLVLIVIWSIVWKMLALWKAARSNHVWWFVALALINTVGLLEILYIFVFSDWGRKPSSNAASVQSSSRSSDSMMP